MAHELTTVSVVQLAPTLGDVAGNGQRVEQAIVAAAGRGVDVAVLPELALSGYCFDSRDEARAASVPLTDPLIERWCRAAATRDSMVVVVGLAEQAGSTVYNSALTLDGSGVLSVYRKVHLWDRERLWFQAGDQLPEVVETAHGRLAAMVCYDLEFPEWPRLAALRGADLLTVPTNWPLFERPSGEPLPELTMARAAARSNHMALAVADRTGLERGVAWSEGSSIIDADGWVRAAAGPGCVTADAALDLRASRDKTQGTMTDILKDRRPELYRDLGSARRET